MPCAFKGCRKKVVAKARLHFFGDAPERKVELCKQHMDANAPGADNTKNKKVSYGMDAMLAVRVLRPVE